MTTASLVAASGCFTAFIVGSRVAFRRERDTTRHLLLLAVTAPLAALVEVLAIASAPSPPVLRYVVGMALFGASLGLFLWAAHTTRRDKFTVAFSADLPRVLVDRGPYGLVRHPFYVAYLAAYVAGFVLTANPWLVPVILTMASLYGYAAVVEERKFRRSVLRSEYGAYRSGTRMFLPVPRRRTSEPGYVR